MSSPRNLPSGNLGNAALATAVLTSRKGDGGLVDRLNEKAQAVQRAVFTAFVISAGVGASALALWFIDRRIKETRAKSSTDRGDDYRAPEGFALRFREAMDGLGTDEDLIIELVSSIPHRKFWDDVQRAYAAQTRGGNLIEDMRSELSDWWVRKALGIIAMKPLDGRDRNNPPSGVTNDQVTRWANAINDAAEYLWGTDEAAMLATLREIPTIAALRRVDSAYRAMYGYGILYELTDELSGGDLRTSLEIILSKPDTNGRTIQQILG